ncbi:hypothetical protein GMOD_00002939 [Pyrenophora seminiperda CCB06]|uniref:Uncharacterized protein n=1 Tax=Pyrenophora seminiperda CCB06 TaxID=1302712 RepID=A0A3M7M3I8_9PLEO|nr:hypothetical protein GMOD_00002939 [Pyrenophora seminiperda CCB06]
MAHAKKKLRWVYRSKAGAVDDLPVNCPSPTDYGSVGDRSLRSSYWSVHDSIEDAGPKVWVVHRTARALSFTRQTCNDDCGKEQTLDAAPVGWWVTCCSVATANRGRQDGAAVA